MYEIYGNVIGCFISYIFYCGVHVAIVNIIDAK